MDRNLYPAVFKWPRDSPRCGATMVSRRMALTAAHCVRGRENIDSDLSMPVELTDGDDNYTTYNIVDIRVNECWNRDIDPYGYNSSYARKWEADIAVLVLDRDISPAGGAVEGTHYLKPWVTADDGSVEGLTFMLAGWGYSGEVGEERDDSNLDRSMTVFHRGFNTVNWVHKNMIH